MVQSADNTSFSSAASNASEASHNQESEEMTVRASKNEASLGGCDQIDDSLTENVIDLTNRVVSLLTKLDEKDTMLLAKMQEKDAMIDQLGLKLQEYKDVQQEKAVSTLPEAEAVAGEQDEEQDDDDDDDDDEEKEDDKEVHEYLESEDLQNEMDAMKDHLRVMIERHEALEQRLSDMLAEQSESMKKQESWCKQSKRHIAKTCELFLKSSESIIVLTTRLDGLSTTVDALTAKTTNETSPGYSTDNVSQESVDLTKYAVSKAGVLGEYGSPFESDGYTLKLRGRWCESTKTYEYPLYLGIRRRHDAFFPSTLKDVKEMTYRDIESFKAFYRMPSELFMLPPGVPATHENEFLHAEVKITYFLLENRPAYPYIGLTKPDPKTMD
jgi:hypothetical protein